MDNEQQPTRPEQTKKGRGSLIGGLIILAIGVILLLQNYFPQITNKLIGPVIIIIVGAGILVSSFRK